MRIGRYTFTMPEIIARCRILREPIPDEAIDLCRSYGRKLQKDGYDVKYSFGKGWYSNKLHYILRSKHGH